MFITYSDGHYFPVLFKDIKQGSVIRIHSDYKYRTISEPLHVHDTYDNVIHLRVPGSHKDISLWDNEQLTFQRKLPDLPTSLGSVINILQVTGQFPEVDVAKDTVAILTAKGWLTLNVFGEPLLLPAHDILDCQITSETKEPGTRTNEEKVNRVDDILSIRELSNDERILEEIALVLQS